MERNKRKKNRNCLSMDETILEDLLQQDLNKQFKFQLTNRSMNSLPSVSGQKLLNFLCKQNVSAKTSELCRIAREINSSQGENLSLNPAEKKRVLEGPKYHSWPKHNDENYEVKRIQVKYHNYGLLDEQDTDSAEDLLDVGKNSQRSWASPSELNMVEPSIYQTNDTSVLLQKTVSCPCLITMAQGWNNLEQHLNNSASMIDLKKLSQFNNCTTENLDGILNNDFKNKFNISKGSLVKKSHAEASSKSTSKSGAATDFDQAYNGVFKLNVLDLIEEEFKHDSSQHQFNSSVESSLFSSRTEKNSSISLYSQDSSDSDSGVGQFSYLLPASKNFDVGVEPALFKKRADVSFFLEFFLCI